MSVQRLRRFLRGPRRVVSRAALPLLERPLPGFAGQVVTMINQARQASFTDPYLDKWRHPGAKPAPFNPTEAAKLLAFVRANADRLNRTAALLADDESRSLLATLLAYRALGPSHVRLPKANSESESYFDRARKLRSSESRFGFPPFEVDHYTLPGADDPIEVDCWLGNVVAGTFERQYWFERGAVRIQPEKGDVVIDAGACFGDTALAFADAVGPSGQVHAFEPVPTQRQILSLLLAARPRPPIDPADVRKARRHKGTG